MQASFRSWAKWSLPAGALLVVAALSVGQDTPQLFNKEQEELFKKNRFQFTQKALAGQGSATKEEIDLAARFFVLRVTYLTALVDPKQMAIIVKDFDDMVTVAASENNSKVNRELVAKFAPVLVQRFRDVLALDFKANRISIVNAATMFPQLARLKQEEIGDFLTSVIEDPKQHDAVRVHALKGLREYFPTKVYNKFDTTKGAQDRKVRDLRRVDAVLKVIERPMAPTSDPAEVDGFRYVRREAVETLAETRAAAVSAISKDDKLEGPVALGLAKILAKKVAPEPSIHERLEAAIGMCNFKKNEVEEYDARIGVYLVGTLMSDFITEYKKDILNIQQNPKIRKPTFLAWKIQSKRLSVALDEMKRNTAGLPAGQSAQNLETLAQPILKSIFNAEGIERDQDLRQYVEKMKPSDKTLFKRGGKSMLDFEFDAPPVE